MIRSLIQKALLFAKTYDEVKDINMLIKCEEVPLYKEILKILNKITIKDLYIDEAAMKENFIPDTITAATIVESAMASIGYFFIPAGMKLPFHDHPNMLVTSKVLVGEVHRRAFDLVDREKQVELNTEPVFDVEDNPFSETRLEAILESDDHFTEGEMLNLTPISGNVHSFMAIKDTIILDVLTPYYDHKTRFCNFYSESDNTKVRPMKKVKKEVTEEDKKKPGFKAQLLYLFKPPKVNFKVVDPSTEILEEFI